MTKHRMGHAVKDKYSFLFAYNRDIILYIRYSDGKIVEANEAAVKEYGYSHEELLRLTIYDLRKQDPPQLVKEQMNPENEDSILLEVDHSRKNGSIFPVRTILPILKKQGKPTRKY